MLFELVKTALRRTGTTFDAEIQEIISAGFADLKRVGIKTPEWTTGGEEPPVEPLLKQAIILYAKAYFGYSDDSEKYRIAYENLKCALSMTGDYIELE